MPKTVGKRILGAVMIIVAGIAVFVLHAGSGMTTDDDAAQVRMAVDPTVLPVVLPDGSESPAGTVGLSDDVNATGETADSTPEDVSPASETPTQPLELSQPAPEPVPSVTESLQAAPEPDFPAATGPKIVKSVVLKNGEGGFTITIVANGPIGDTSYMNLDTPRRLVLDLREKWSSRAGNVIRSAQGPVKHVVIGEHPDRLRMVVHFRTPPKAKLEPEFTRSGNSVTISVVMP